MLKQRLLTISFLLPAFIYLVLYANDIMFIGVTALILSLAANEWIKLLKLNQLIHYMLLVLFGLLLGLLCIYQDYWLDNVVIINQIVLIATVFWIIALVNILLYSRWNWLQQLLADPKYIAIYGYVSCVLALIPSWLALNYLKANNNTLLLFGCLIIMMADIGAYIVGRLFGKHKLTKISAGKTWEGIIGGWLGTLILTIICLIAANLSSDWQIIWRSVVLTSVTCIFSVVGDLFESLFKRISGVKDSGSILPGHGGVLDRIDSFCSAMPIFLLFVLLLS